MEIPDSTIMPFGKHKGEKMANIPPDYLIYIYEHGKCYGTIRQYIQENLQVLREEIKRSNN